MCVFVCFLECANFVQFYTYKGEIKTKIACWWGLKLLSFCKLAHSCVCCNQSGALCHTSLPYAGTLALFLGKLFILKHTQKTLLAKQWLSPFFFFFHKELNILFNCCTGLMASCVQETKIQLTLAQAKIATGKTKLNSQYRFLRRLLK